MSADPVNVHYYSRLEAGRDDYWRRMAAPRARTETFLRLLSEEPARSLVDLGCGNGRLVAEIASRNPSLRLAGLDLSEAQVEENRRRTPGAEWKAFDLVSENPLPDTFAGSFDVAVASELIEHLPAPEQMLLHARQLVRPGGRLLLSTQSGPLRETERRVGHLRHWSAAEIADLLVKSGWRVERAWNEGYPFHDLSKWWANRDPDRTMARFSERPYGTSEKVVCALLRGAFRLNSRRRGAQLYAVARRPAGENR